MPCPAGHRTPPKQKTQPMSAAQSNTRHRQSTRLSKFDYSQPGMYFITICTQHHACLFGKIANDNMQLYPTGEIAKQCWLDIPQHFSNVTLDVMVVMPNHLHGIITIIEAPVGAVRARHAVPLRALQEDFGRPVPRSIPTIVRSYKSAVTRQINAARSTPGQTIWQRNFYEHVIRDEADYVRIAEYVGDNPRRWAEDVLHPGNGVLTG